MVTFPCAVCHLCRHTIKHNRDTVPTFVLGSSCYLRTWRTQRKHEQRNWFGFLERRDEQRLKSPQATAAWHKRSHKIVICLSITVHFGSDDRDFFYRLQGSMETLRTKRSNHPRDAPPLATVCRRCGWRDRWLTYFLDTHSWEFVAKLNDVWC